MKAARDITDVEDLLTAYEEASASFGRTSARMFKCRMDECRAEILLRIARTPRLADELAVV